VITRFNGFYVWCTQTQRGVASQRRENGVSTVGSSRARSRGLRASGRGRAKAAPGRGAQCAAKDSIKVGVPYEPRPDDSYSYQPSPEPSQYPAFDNTH
jgi:hypothetical protein